MQQRRSRKILWSLWVIMTLAASGYLWAALVGDDAPDLGMFAWGKQFFLPGATTHGHHQIELACEACHVTPFGGQDEMQDACLECHDAELDEAEDSHPVRLFTDPRNFEMREKVDAVYCVACHVEHKPEITHAVGVTVPSDHCLVCHRDIAAERPTHKELEPDSCAAAGCHNYHDNRALYEEFLLKHPREPAVLATPRVQPRDFADLAARLASYPVEEYPPRALSPEDQDGAGHANPELLDDWATTGHAKAGVNCGGCHRPDSAKAWAERPTQQVCANCHEAEVGGWLTGLHGMRIAQELSAMTPARAQLPMKHAAANKQLSCDSCHAAHRFDVVRAAVDDCLQCHNDEHTLAYRASPHHDAWRREIAGPAPPGSGVSCSTCHLPRVTHRDGDIERVLVEHNQNDNLRPNTKMLRPVCLECHGLQLALDALADKHLIDNNFNGKPTRRVESLDMAQRTERRHRRERRHARADEDQD